MTLREKDDLKAAVIAMRQMRNSSPKVKDEQFYDRIVEWLSQMDEIYNMFVNAESSALFYDKLKQYFLTTERNYLTALESYEKAAIREEEAEANTAAEKKAKERSDAILKEVLEEAKADKQ